MLPLAQTAPINESLMAKAATVEWSPEQSTPADIAVESLRHRGVDRLTYKLNPAAKKGLFGFLFGRSAAAKLKAVITIADEIVTVEVAQRKSTFRLSNVQAVELDHDDPKHAREIRVKANDRTLQIGRGLSPASLRWLRDRLLLEAAGLMWKPIFHVGKRATAKTVLPDNDVYTAWSNEENSLIQYFVSEAPERARHLLARLRDEDFNEVVTSAQWMKSTAAVVGAGYLSEICQRLELEVASEDRKRLPVLMQHFRSEFNKVLKRLCEVAGEDAEPLKLSGESAGLDGVGQTAAPSRILLVEDSVFNQMIATELLSAAGHQVTVAAHGNEALVCLENESFDLILMDCQMPVLDGFETTKRIRAREFRLGRARTPIVALTAHALQDDRKRCLGSDMDDYLSKPYAPEELLEMVEYWLGPAPSFEMDEDDRPGDPGEQVTSLSEEAEEAELAGETEPAPARQPDAMTMMAAAFDTTDETTPRRSDAANYAGACSPLPNDVETAAVAVIDLETGDRADHRSTEDTDNFADDARPDAVDMTNNITAAAECEAAPDDLAVASSDGTCLALNGDCKDLPTRAEGPDVVAETAIAPVPAELIADAARSIVASVAAQGEAASTQPQDIAGKELGCEIETRGANEADAASLDAAIVRQATPMMATDIPAPTLDDVAAAAAALSALAAEAAGGGDAEEADAADQPRDIRAAFRKYVRPAA